MMCVVYVQGQACQMYVAGTRHIKSYDELWHLGPQGVPWFFFGFQLHIFLGYGGHVVLGKRGCNKFSSRNFFWYRSLARCHSSTVLSIDR